MACVLASRKKSIKKSQEQCVMARHWDESYNEGVYKMQPQSGKKHINLFFFPLLPQSKSDLRRQKITLNYNEN